MKKLICLVLALMTLLCIVPCAMAEDFDFTFVGNVKFGMTFDEVTQALQDLGINCEAAMANNATASLMASLGVTGNKYIYLRKQDNVTVAGYAVSGYYFFDTNDQLAHVIYYIKSNPVSSSYTPIENLLIRQYGETEYSSATGKQLGLPVSLRPATYSNDNITTKFAINKYTERLVPYIGEGNVLIEHFHYDETIYSSGSVLLTYDSNAVCYSVVTDAQSMPVPSDWGL